MRHSLTDPDQKDGPKANEFEVVGRISPEQWRKWAKTGHS
jgi:hypothetical protein